MLASVHSSLSLAGGMTGGVGGSGRWEETEKVRSSWSSSVQ